jgi:hypothetical protein
MTNFHLANVSRIITEYEQYKNREPLDELIREGGKDLLDKRIRDLILDLLNGKDRHEKWANPQQRQIEKRNRNIIGMIYYYRAQGLPVWYTGNKTDDPNTCCHKALEELKLRCEDEGVPCTLTSPESIHKNIWLKRKKILSPVFLKIYKDMAFSAAKPVDGKAFDKLMKQNRKP